MIYRCKSFYRWWLVTVDGISVVSGFIYWSEIMFKSLPISSKYSTKEKEKVIISPSGVKKHLYLSSIKSLSMKQGDGYTIKRASWGQTTRLSVLVIYHCIVFRRWSLCSSSIPCFSLQCFLQALSNISCCSEIPLNLFVSCQGSSGIQADALSEPQLPVIVLLGLID